MKNILLIVGVISSLFTSPSCNNSKESEITITDSSGKVQYINPDSLLMTLPTIENSFPSFEDRSSSNNLSILEDDWRQIEFISKDQKGKIQQEIDSIDNIFQHYSHKNKDFIAFKKLYVRNLITIPISIPLDKIVDLLGDVKQKVVGISISGNAGQVKNGFSLSANGLDYYGLKDENNNVSVFCLYAAESGESLKKSIKRISNFLAKENLYLVDWPQRRLVDEHNIHRYFDVGSKIGSSSK